MRQASALSALSTVVADRAASDPHGLAVVGGGARLTWSELDAAVATVAGALAADAAGPGGRLALVVRPSLAAVVAVHAAIRSGATIAMLDPRRSLPEVRSLLAAVAPGLVVADDPRPLADAGLGRNAGLGRIVGLTTLARVGVQRPVTSTDAAADATTFLVPTSGTTGRPRLAKLRLATLEASARAWARVLPEATGWLLSLGLAHVAGLGIVVRAALAGVPVVVPDGPETDALIAALARPSTAAGPTKGEEATRRPKVSHLSLVPTQLARLLDATPGGCPPGVRAVLLGGGPIPPALATRAIAAGWPVVPSYGMTETGSGVVALPTAEAAEAPGTVGRPLPGVELRIGGPLGPDGAGRIEVRGPMLFDGYEGDPEATRAALRSGGWLATRDLGRIDRAGRLIVVDRLDDMIISGGENVAPAEVETVLRDHPAVAEAGVVGLPDDEWGAVPAAAVVPRPATAADAEDIRSFVRGRLAGFEVPTRIVFIGELPRTPDGKLVRRELRPQLLEPSLAVLDQPRPERGSPATTVLLLHATLSSSAQLLPLVRRLGSEARVLAPDRRGSGRSRMAVPATLPIARHVADLLEVLDRAAVERVVVVGHSFGGVVGLELAARHPDRVAGLLAWEPPYVALAPDPVRVEMADLAVRVAEAHATQGPPAAARRFLDAVAGDGAWAALRPRQQAALGAAGDGVLADVAMPDLVPDGLAGIRVPTVIATGAASEPFYRPIADALVARIPGARLVTLPGLRHPAPITDPEPIAGLVRDLLERSHARRSRHPSRSRPYRRSPDDRRRSPMTDEPRPTVPDPSGAASETGNASETARVGAMFDRISGVYDVMNAVISGFQEPRWRRRAVAETRLRPGMAAIDVATGTGKVAASLGQLVGPGGRVLGVDVAPRMIERARRGHADRPWLSFEVGDAMALPAGDETFDAATIAFGMRNLPDYRQCFAEMRRVVRRGGFVVCLEIARPATPIGRLGRLWFERVVPLLGRLAGQGRAYAYLVESVRNYPDPERIATIMGEAGLVDVRWIPLTFGMVTVHVGRRPASGQDALESSGPRVTAAT